MMQSRFTSILLATGALALLSQGAWGESLAKPSLEYQIDGKIFGMPPAEVFEEAYDGPPAVGEYLTLAPALAPLPPGNRTHDVRLDVIAREIEVGPDIRYRAWTFGGSVPGPVLHVREGDRVNFIMKNRSAEVVALTPPTRGAAPFLSQLAALDLQQGRSVIDPMPHSMDFHAGMVAMTDKWRVIQAGESIRFQFVANYPGIFIYHCGSPPVLQHMAMGQYGVVVVSPREGYPTDAEVDREYVIVQSEFYLKPGAEGDPLYSLDYDAALAKQPSIVAFNGHQTALLQHPLAASKGDRVRFYVHNIGPTDTSSFHVIGTIFDRVWYEGNLANEMRGMQTVLLGASNGAVLEFIVPEAGGYAFVDHEFADAAKGAVGKLVTDLAAHQASGTAMQGH
jgi:nitrite reductase (NO-forming)